MILGITGHRPPGLFGSYDIPTKPNNKVYQALLSKFKELQPEKIISGMAQGTDTFAAQAAVDLAIPFIAAVPCDDQDSLWPEPAKRIYHDLLDKAAEVVIVSPGPYAPDKNHIRDRYIVVRSDNLLAVWNGQKFGGTFATVRIAQKEQATRKNYQVWVIDPTNIVT